MMAAGDNVLSTPEYEVLAFRYATTDPERPRHENFISVNDFHDAPMPLDYFVWLIRGNDRDFLVDTGFGMEAAGRRRRILTARPAELLRQRGIEPTAIKDVIITHLHYDHAGCLDDFPSATFHLQDTEMAFATGRHMCHACLNAPYDVEDVKNMVGLVYGGRVEFHNGDAEIFPGIEVFRIGGHSDGLQVVRVNTARGKLVLASDAFHFNENRLKRSPFPIVFDVGAMMEGFKRCEALAGHDETLLVPGHDPDVIKRWPRLYPDDENIVRLDLVPIA